MTGANLRTYQVDVMNVTVGATPILVNLNQQYVTGAMIMPGTSLGMANGTTFAAATWAPIICTVKIDGPARFYLASPTTATASILVYKTANDSIYGS